MLNCKEKPHRGMTMVASRFNGWDGSDKEKRAFRYATSYSYRVPTARYLLNATIPAVKTAGYHYLMPTASATAAND